MSQLRTGLRWGLGVLVATGLLALPGGARAQDLSPVEGQMGVSSVAADGAMAANGIVPEGTALELPQPAPEPRTFGTASAIAHTIQAFAFIPLSSTTAYTAAGLAGALRCVTVGCFFVAPVSLPAGALVTSIQGEVCDTDGVDNVSMTFFRVTAPGGTIPTALANAESSGAPGCVFIDGALAAPETIVNMTNSYGLQVGSGSTSATRFFSVRIFYTLQVSPAPAVASFGDVPTSHPFFPFIEALKASGITGGCQASPPLFCPDAPLTRGQMATFLAIALGLHFAP